MQTNYIGTKKNIQRRNNSKKNATKRKKNIFELTASIPKNYFTWLDNEQSQFTFEFAENLLVFLEKRYPRTLKKLQFNEQNDINDLITALIRIYESLGFPVVFNSNDFNESSVRILYPVDFCFMWYTMELKYMDLIESPELKLGYVMLIKKYAEHCWHDPLSSNQPFENINDNQYASEFEWNETLEDEAVESGHEPEDYCRWNNNVELNWFREQKEKMIAILNMPEKTFFNYTPKNDDEAAFKDFLTIGLKNIDFTIIHKFLDNEDISISDSMSFKEAFCVFFDLDNPLEDSYFENINMNSDNGITDICGYWEVKNGNIKNMTPPKDLKKIKELTEYIAQLYQQFLNNL